jgi:putative NIF3 family GTP cyclohydrolase 1 type 2
MNVSLTPELKLDDLKAAISEGKKAIDEGHYTKINNAEELNDFMEDVKKSAAAKMKEKEIS